MSQPFVYCIIVLVSLFSFDRVVVAQIMFRGSADHNSNYNSGVKGSFNEVVWKFQPAFPSKVGIAWGLRKFWAAPLGLAPSQKDIVLGSDENGLASAWDKKFNPAKGSGFVQIWAGESDLDLSFITRVSEYGLK